MTTLQCMAVIAVHVITQYYTLVFALPSILRECSIHVSVLSFALPLTLTFNVATHMQETVKYEVTLTPTLDAARKQLFQIAEDLARRQIDMGLKEIDPKE